MGGVLGILEKHHFISTGFVSAGASKKAREFRDVGLRPNLFFYPFAGQMDSAEKGAKLSQRVRAWARAAE